MHARKIIHKPATLPTLSRLAAPCNNVLAGRCLVDKGRRVNGFEVVCADHMVRNTALLPVPTVLPGAVSRKKERRPPVREYASHLTLGKNTHFGSGGSTTSRETGGNFTSGKCKTITTHDVGGHFYPIFLLSDALEHDPFARLCGVHYLPRRVGNVAEAKTVLSVRRRLVPDQRREREDNGDEGRPNMARRVLA